MEYKVFTIPLAATTEPAARDGGDCLGNWEMHGAGAPRRVREEGTGEREMRLEFIAGPENRLAGAAIDWLLHPGEHSYSPVVFHGPPGTGKSFLARAIGQARADAICTNGADFARELAGAIEGQTVASWREQYRSAGLLVLDDVEQLAGKKAAQQELLHTLDALEAREATAVVTSRRSPAQLAGLSRGLSSRLAGGLVVSVALPGTEARTVILDRWAGARGIGLEPDAARLLAEALGVTAAELHGVLMELEAEAHSGRGRKPASAERNTIGREQVRQYLALRRARHGPLLNDVSKLVAKYYGLKQSDLLSSSRRRQVVLARNVAIYLGRQLTGSSLKQLGEHFGGRDHTTVLHSLRSVETQLAGDGSLRSALSALRRLLEDGSNEGENMSHRRR